MKRKEQTTSLLNAVNTAILELIGGAVSYTVSTADGSKSYTRADLATLREMRKELRNELRAYSNSGRPPVTMTGVRYV